MFFGSNYFGPNALDTISGQRVHILKKVVICSLNNNTKIAPRIAPHLESHPMVHWYTLECTHNINRSEFPDLICLLHSYLKKKGVRCPLPLPPWEPRSLGDLRWPFICRTKSHCSLDSSYPRIHAGYVKQCSVTQTLNFNSPGFALPFSV